MYVLKGTGLVDQSHFIFDGSKASQCKDSRECHVHVAAPRQ